jgi:predicted nucleic-acid-binding Zn-ribbon protein
MAEYERKVGGEEKVTIRGVRCNLCGYTELADDEAIWTAVGL